MEQRIAVARRLGEEPVGPGVAVGLEPANAVVDAVHAAGIAAADDHRARIAAAGGRCGQSLAHLGRLDHPLAGQVAAPFVGRLVFELDRCGPRRLEQPHRLLDVLRAAEARVGIDHDRDRDGPGQDPRLFDELLAGEEADVRYAEPAGRKRRARKIDRIEARLLDEPAGQCEGGTDDAEHLFGDGPAEGSPSGRRGRTGGGRG